MPVGDESKHRLFKKVNDDPTPPQASKTTCNFCQLLAAFVAVVAHLLCFRDITLGPIQHSFESGLYIDKASLKVSRQVHEYSISI